MSMREKVYYFDYMATSPVDARVIEKMKPYLGQEGVFGNPSSVTHVYGQQALEAIETARLEIAEVIHAHPSEMIFTSGATESNHLAILGSARLYQRKGKHLITMQTEHAAVLGPMQILEREGFEVTYLPPQSDGLLDLATLRDAIRPETILVSIMHVNNETGVIQDISSISPMLKGRGVLLHVDAAQSIGKLEVNVKEMGVDFMSLSAHKAYGPKGVGALFIRGKPKVRILPLAIGGGQERGLRPGTLPTHQIMGMSEAFKIGEAVRAEESASIFKLREQLWSGIKHFPWIHLNGHPTLRVANNLNISISGVSGDQLLGALPQLAVSSTSACTSALTQPSHVLKAMGLSDALALSSIRFSIGRYTTSEEVGEAVKILCQVLPALRGSHHE